jgi:hypothetical protein
MGRPSKHSPEVRQAERDAAHPAGPDDDGAQELKRLQREVLELTTRQRES